MPHPPDAGLTLGVALAAGILAQALARHLRIPGIVLLLGTGVLLGPDLLDIVRPTVLGDSLSTLVGFAVAVILFEGGLNLDLARLRRSAGSIRRLVTIGALITAVGGALSARWILGWGWRLSVLFGTLVIVTGPTVITPLLRRIRVKRSVGTVLEAEGVLIDPIGAVVAVVTLEVLTGTLGAADLSAGLRTLVLRFGLGLVLGALGGLAIALALRHDRLVPEGLHNVFVLSLVLALFEISDFLVDESGIMTVTVAGFVAGNVRSRVLGHLKEFKEQLTVLLIGLLFVLLAADVRLAGVYALGWAGVATVLALMLVVRPLNAWICTAGSGLAPRERAFIAWMAPRGIVAAAVSSLFAQEMRRHGIAGGSELQALVFLVIAMTVLLQGLSGGPVAGLLGLRRPTNSGFVILGANAVGRALAGAFRAGGEDTLLIDSDPMKCQRAEADGFRVLYGNAFSERILFQAELDSRAGLVATTSNEEVNFMLARRGREEFKVPEVWLGLRKGQTAVTREMVEQRGGRVLFGAPRDLSWWTLRLEREMAAVERWTLESPERGGEVVATTSPPNTGGLVLPIALQRRGSVRPVDRTTQFRAGDVLWLAVAAETRDEAVAWLGELGWKATPAQP